MLSLSWMFLWIASGEKITAFNLSDCATKNIIWTYSASREETFILFCDLSNYIDSKKLSDVQWYRQSQMGESLGEIIDNYPHISKHNRDLHFTTIGVNDSGSYICRPRIRTSQDEAFCAKTVLEVKLKTNSSCKNHESHKISLLLATTDYIYCPCLSPHGDVSNPKVTWYQDGKLISKGRKNSFLINDVYTEHTGTYRCDYTQSDNSSSWIVRAFIQVMTYERDTDLRPDILDPISDTLEVELGKPLTLNCTVQFGFEQKLKPVVRWYQDFGQGWTVLESEEKCPESTREELRFKCVVNLKEVTWNDLNGKFICFAQNSVGNVTRSIQLRPKERVVLIYVLLSTAVTLAGVLTVCALLYTYWIEIVLLYRTYQSKDETLWDKKEFDAFISYAKCNSFERETTLFLSEESLALNLFPEVLENKYGYTLCLLERDVAPGGVYAEDVVSIIKKSRRGIFILSPSYVNGPGLFELQAAVNLALDDQMLKLILIKFCPFQEPEALPPLVKKALKVLPTVTWRGSKSLPLNSRFWSHLHYYMPVRNTVKS
ncbi:interleukin-18 receptor accessory protein [Erinaceus europaeus]|uniref:Interleukin-18 receptor accessory protein n=1 Tax=Erinaceus europaeus TaxID=9365 RepID=A0ABM3X6Z1_ERIEU|nr:interleukin-18 receptor accessory protein [Erinaceus europaeus]